MNANPPRLDKAFNALGLAPSASLSEAKTAFRDRVKSLHPDRTPPTEESLASLSEAITAMRDIESGVAFETEIWLSPEQVRTGVTRLVSSGMRREFVRIPPGTADGAVLSAIGNSASRITVRHKADMSGEHEVIDGKMAIEQFVADFAAPSPASRFAGWARRRSSAA